MTFTLLIWNIWLKNQLKGRDGSGRLLGDLGRLIDQYQPDFIGLNEVLKSIEADSPFVFDYLKDEHGYNFTHFAHASPITNDWIIGTGFCSRTEPQMTESFVMCGDVQAVQRGHKNQQVRAIKARVLVGEEEVHIIVAHPIVLRPSTLKEHYRATETLERLVRSSECSSNAIVAGDFNEPGFMPKAFKDNVADIMHMRTGATWDTTWRLEGMQHVPIRANLDQLYWAKKSNFTLERFEVVETNVSDHRPMVATFRIQ